MKLSDSSIIDIDLGLITSIISAVEQAVTDDIPRERKERHLETDNYLAFLRGDYINQNLRDKAGVVGGTLLPFKRYGWKGRLLIDPEHKLTFSVTSQSNLQQIPRKHRAKPHFLQTLLYEENGKLNGKFQQTSFFQMDGFDDDTYNADFEDIVGDTLESFDGYHHCVIAYQSKHDELVDVKLILLDQWFNVVEEHSLNHLRKPDFSQLTSEVYAAESSQSEHNKATRNLTKLKPGIKPGLWEEEKKG